jgi:hypothetical protein
VKYTGFKETGDHLMASAFQRVTFTEGLTTVFGRNVASTVGGFSGMYLWSTPGNWSNGVPVNGGDVVFNATEASNPAGYDDIGQR